MNVFLAVAGAVVWSVILLIAAYYVIFFAVRDAIRAAPKPDAEPEQEWLFDE